MSNLRSIHIDTTKKYLIISKSVHFLEAAKNCIYDMLNISSVSDTKHDKNSMSIETLIFKDGGYIKFDIYSNDIRKNCKYDYVLVDKFLYTLEYVKINTACVLSIIIPIETIDEISFTDFNEVNKKDIKDRYFDHIHHIDYGNCPNCNNKVSNFENNCGKCGLELNWDITKDLILKRCHEVSLLENEIRDKIGDDIKYNPYYILYNVIGFDRLAIMSDKCVIFMYETILKTIKFIE